MTASDKYTSETITWTHRWAPNLFSFRTTRPKNYTFVAGQFARLGVDKVDGAADDSGAAAIVWRAYSMASGSDDAYFEFYSIIVPDGEFSMAFANVAVGDTIHVEKTSYGFLTTDRFQNGKALWMFSTGTGLAPFLAILWDQKNWGDYENLIVVHSVRTENELAYRETITSFGRNALFRDLPAKLHYVPTPTREHREGMLAGRITLLIADRRLEDTLGLELEPVRTRAMICGNPGMVVETRKLLTARGLAPSRRAAPGQMAVENYW